MLLYESLVKLQRSQQRPVSHEHMIRKFSINNVEFNYISDIVLQCHHRDSS